MFIQLNLYSVKRLPNEMFIQLNAKLIQPGRSQFHQGKACNLYRNQVSCELGIAVRACFLRRTSDIGHKGGVYKTASNTSHSIAGQIARQTAFY
jgi:hypothetical protein